MSATSKCGYGAAGLIGAVLISSVVFYGCSQEQAPVQVSQQAAPPQTAPAADQGQPTGQQVVVDEAVKAKAKEHFMNGIQFARNGKIDDAIKEYEASIKLNPNNAEALSNLGFAYYDKGYVDKPIAAHLAALKINNKLANAYYGLGLAFERKKDKKNAIKAWKGFIALGEPHSKYWMAAQERLAKLEGRKMKKTTLKGQAEPSTPAPADKTHTSAKDAK